MRLAICGPVSTDALCSHLSVPGDAPKGLGGAAVNRLVRELLRRGHRIVVISCDPSVPLGKEVLVEGDALRIRYGPFRPRHRARDAFRDERRYLATALRREAPDVVHAHWTYEFALGALASGRPTLITCRDWAPAILRHAPDAYRAVRLGMQMTVMAKGRHFTAVSPYIQRRVARLVRANVIVVPNGLEDEAFNCSERELELPPTFVSVNAGFSHRKNVDTLIHAFGHLRIRVPAARLMLVGPGYEVGGSAHVWSKKRKLDAGIEFVGEVVQSSVGKILSRADVLVHPSREESFGNVLIEAMARKTPVVGGLGSGAVPWVLDNGRAGVLTDVTSPKHLAAAMEGLLDAGTWLDHSRAGHAHAWKAFRMEKVVDLYERCYANVLKAEGT